MNSINGLNPMKLLILDHFFDLQKWQLHLIQPHIIRITLPCFHAKNKQTDKQTQTVF